MSPSLIKVQLQNVILESKKTIAGSIVLGIVFLLLLSEIHFNMTLAYIWFVTLASMTLFRLYLNHKTLPLLDSLTLEDFKTVIKTYSFVIGGVGFLWGFIFYLGITHAPQIYDFMILAAAIGFIGSAILSTAAYLPFYLFMNLPIIVFTTIALIQEPNKEYQIGLFIALLAFVYILISAIRYSKYFKDQHEREFELRDTKNEIIRALGRAGEYRDEETGNHILRMSNACYLMAKELGMSEERAVMIRNASSMHDVGKIGIPDNILLKPDKLSEEEYGIIKTHPEIGRYILGDSSIELLELSRTIALSHHEKWDGTGYPKGLKGEEIPLEGRIAAISDVFDALTSERPYKHAWPIEEAAKYIQDQSGKHFDPELVPVFIKLLSQVSNYRDQHYG